MLAPSVFAGGVWTASLLRMWQVLEVLLYLG
jgi:hypothetical protein